MPSAFTDLTFTSYTDSFDAYFLYKEGQRTIPATRPSQPLPKPMDSLCDHLATDRPFGFTECCERLLDLNFGERTQFAISREHDASGLMASLTERLSETAPIWARAVAPVAEWVAQALWSRQSKSSEQLLPTRLTQRRRAEGRGNTLATPVLRYVSRPKICELCGAEGIKNRYCRSCGVEVSRENMTRAALISHARPTTARVKRKISKRLSEHAVANTWWSPSNLPVWLTEMLYVQKIQPQLRTLKVREIAQAMQVSQPYAALIRSGRRRPHQRHWQALANLVSTRP